MGKWIYYVEDDTSIRELVVRTENRRISGDGI